VRWSSIDAHAHARVTANLLGQHEAVLHETFSAPCPSILTRAVHILTDVTRDTIARIVARMIGIGVDFGTSNSVMAAYDGESITLVALEPSGPILPTATYIDRSFRAATGEDAIRRYVDDNTGRPVELVPEVVGRAEILIGEHDESSRDAPEVATYDAFGTANVDLNMKGRLFRGIKRLLGNEHTDRLMVFDRPYRMVALMTPLLLRMRQTAERALSNPVNRVHVGRPVNYEGTGARRNELAVGRLREACRHAGLTRVVPLPEPTAATLSYLESSSVQPDLTLTFDFGGGTLDLCLLRRRLGGFEVIATHGIALGGDRIDQRLFERLLFPLLGKGETWRRQGVDRRIDTRFPFELYEPLLVNWAMTYLLNQGRFRGPVLERIAEGGPASRKFERLNDLVSRNYGYAVFQALRSLKANLSEREEATLDIPEIDVALTVSRTQFEVLIADFLDEAAAAVDGLLAAARIYPANVDAVVRTGGSSLIPAVERLLEDRFPGRVYEHDPFTSVAAGLALADYRLRESRSR